jgi:hypothetical protein
MIFNGSGMNTKVRFPPPALYLIVISLDFLMKFTRRRIVRRILAGVIEAPAMDYSILIYGAHIAAMMKEALSYMRADSASWNNLLR